MPASVQDTYFHSSWRDGYWVIRELNNKLMPDIRNAIFKHMNNKSCKILKKERFCGLKWLERGPLMESRGKLRFWTTIWVSSKRFGFLFSQCWGQACGQEPRQSSLASHQEIWETAVGLSELAQEDQMGRWPHPPHWQGWNPGLQRSLQTSCPLAYHIATYSTRPIWKSLKWKKHD